MTAAISLQGVVKRFGKFAAVDGLDLEIPHGTTFGLLGPNGAGKTTTIRMIMNITKPDAGEIRVLGEKMNDKLQERIGYLPEERGLYRKMKVVDQLLFFATIKGVDRQTRDEAPLAVDRLDGPQALAPEEDRGAEQGHAAEGAVPRHDRARPGDPDPRRAVLRPRPDQRRPREGLPDRVQEAAERRSSSRRTSSSRPSASASRIALLYPGEEAPRRHRQGDQARVPRTGSRFRRRSSRSPSSRRSSSSAFRSRASRPRPPRS